MAKFAKVGYGSDGRGTGKVGGYLYVVNDNVRTGDRLQVIATSQRNRKFATTGVPIHTYKELSSKGMEAKREAMEDMTEKEKEKGIEMDKDITRAYTGKEMGLQRSGISQKDYNEEVRAGNIEMYKREHPNAEFTEKSEETFDSYSSKFMGNERRER